MGTRNLTVVKHNGEYKIAQYGQWDGYPSGQGITVLEFLRKNDLETFKQRLKDIRYYTEGELKVLEVKYANSNKWKEELPELSRDVGAEVLSLVMDGANRLQNHITFAGDSLMCEYGYVVDFDKNVFEVYEGFNTEEVTDGRFLSNDESLTSSSLNKYHPIILIKSYNLNNLPTNEAFLRYFDEDYVAPPLNETHAKLKEIIESEFERLHENISDLINVGDTTSDIENICITIKKLLGLWSVTQDASIFNEKMDDEIDFDSLPVDLTHIKELMSLYEILGYAVIQTDPLIMEKL